jgi:hypothetical protein
MVYIICDQHDAKATIDLWKLLEGRGFEPRLPLFKGDAGKIRSQNDQLLKDCSATLIYYGAGDCAWYENQLAEIRKAGLPTPVWTYLAQPDTPHKQKLLCSPDAEDIVDGTSALPEADISVLLSNLAHRSTAKGGA